jgi:hypothetical protein
MLMYLGDLIIAAFSLMSFGDIVVVIVGFIVLQLLPVTMLGLDGYLMCSLFRLSR